MTKPCRTPALMAPHSDSMPFKTTCCFLFVNNVEEDLAVANIELRPWQEDALELIEAPSEREVIWITGSAWGFTNKACKCL